LAAFLLDAIEAGRAPAAIITFNADTILETMMQLLQFQRDFAKYGDWSNRRHVVKQLRHERSAPGGALGVYHLHGCLTPAPRPGPKRIGRGSWYRTLVFVEADFTRMAVGQGGWAQTTYLYHAQHNKLVLLGMSMADPNIRRWMVNNAEQQRDGVNAVHAAQSGLAPGATTSHLTLPPLDHFWITKRPNSQFAEDVLDQSLSHLGIRTVFLDDWSELIPRLRKMTGL
jgi:hypothetical protein